jgi:hypothetical protein
VHLHDIDGFYHEWDIDSLPWPAVTPVPIGCEHPDTLDQNLVDALSQGPLAHVGPDTAKMASLAFLYMYMSLSVNHSRYHFSTVYLICIGANGFSDPHSTSPLARLCLSVQVWAPRLHIPLVLLRLSFFCTSASAYPNCPCHHLLTISMFRTRADELFLHLLLRRLIDGLSLRRRFFMAIRVVWTTAWLYTGVPWPTLVQGSIERAGWKIFRGELISYPSK